MMRGPTYDDGYITRKMSSLHGPTFAPPGGVASYGRPPPPMGGYMQDSYTPYSTTSLSSSTSILPDIGTSSSSTLEDYRESSPGLSTSSTGYRPSAATQLILNRVALRNSSRSSLPPMGRGYPPMGPPPPRMVPRMGPPPPGYYDYDYGGYGGGYGGYGGYGYGGYAPPPPRMSRYDTYMDDELPEPTYTPRHRSRVPDTLDDMDVRDKGAAPAHHPPPPPHHHQALVPMPPSVTALRDLPPMSINDVDDSYSEQPRRLRKAHLQSSPGIEPPPHLHVPGGETEGDRQLAKMQARYPSLSEPQMLQDHVDKMRIRLKSIAFSLDPSGPVPDIIVPDRPKKGGAADADKKYSQALEFNDLPKVATRRQRYYPEDEYLKDNLRIKCLSHYKTTRTAADAQMSTVPSDSSSSRYDKLAGAKWEEPDTVFGTPSEKKPFSKSLTDGTTEESDERKERRKKKKSKERDLPETPAVEAPPAQSASTPAPPSDFSTTSEVESAAKDAVSIGDEEGMDEKELKKLEKKKRKAEREAAAKAAMEAELAALAAAEAELARLEAETSTLKTDSPAPAPVEVSVPVEVPTPAAPAKEPSPAPAPAPAPAEPATEVKSESAAEKCESSTEVVCEGVSVTPESLGEIPPPESPLQVPPQEEQQSPQVEQMPVEVEEPPKVVEEPRVESQVEEVPQVESHVVEEPRMESQIDDVPQVESHGEEPPAEPLAEDVPAETVVEVAQEEQPQAEPQVEQPQPILQVETHIDEIQGDAHFITTYVESEVEPKLDEPAVEPQLEEVLPAVVDETPVVEENVKEPECEARSGEDIWADVAPTDGGAENLGTEAAPVEDLPPSTEPPAAAGTEDALSGKEEGKQNVSAAGEDDGGTYVIDAAAAAVAAAAAANRSEDLLE